MLLQLLAGQLANPPAPLAIGFARCKGSPNSMDSVSVELGLPAAKHHGHADKRCRHMHQYTLALPNGPSVNLRDVLKDQLMLKPPAKIPSLTTKMPSFYQ